MTILQMKYFVTVAEYSSFTKAAEKLYVSQQGISRQIAAAEKELGLVLIDRNNRRKIVLTAAGEAVLPVWKQILSEYDDVLEEAMIRSGKVHKKLKIGIFEAGPIIDYVMPLINGYRAHYPDADIECVFGSEEFVMNGLEESKIDLALALCAKYRDYIIKSYPIYYDRLCIAISKKHPLASRKELSVRDLAEYPLYVLNSSYSFDANYNIRTLLAENGLGDGNIVEVKDVNNLEMMLHMAKGAAFAPHILLRNTDDEICFFPTEDRKNGDSIVLYIIWKKDKMKAEAMKLIGI